MPVAADDLVDVTVDADVCVMVRMCASVAPESFVDGADCETTYVPGDKPDAALAIEAAESCPSGAITVRRRGTGEVLFP